MHKSQRQHSPNTARYPFFLFVMAGVEGSEAVMVGDDMKDDVAGALNAGIGAGLLVRTGKYLPNDEYKHGVEPTATGKYAPSCDEHCAALSFSSEYH